MVASELLRVRTGLAEAKGLEKLTTKTSHTEPVQDLQDLEPGSFLVRMVSRKHKRVWRYVEEGNLLKLKSYLRKHRDLDVNFSQGRRQRSPLHLACSRGDDAVLRVLLGHGADVLQKDFKGDTALHTAANRALKHGKTGKELRGMSCFIPKLSVVICCLFVCFSFSLWRPGCAPQKELSRGHECSQQRRSYTWRPAQLVETRRGNKRHKERHKIHGLGLLL